VRSSLGYEYYDAYLRRLAPSLDIELPWTGGQAETASGSRCLRLPLPGHRAPPPGMAALGPRAPAAVRSDHRSHVEPGGLGDRGRGDTLVRRARMELGPCPERRPAAGKGRTMSALSCCGIPPHPAPGSPRRDASGPRRPPPHQLNPDTAYPLLAGAHSARRRASMRRSSSSICMTQASASAESPELPRGPVQVRMPACRLTRLLGSRHQRHRHSRLRTLAHIMFMSPPGLCHVPRTQGRRPARPRDPAPKS